MRRLAIPSPKRCCRNQPPNRCSPGPFVFARLRNELTIDWVRYVGSLVYLVLVNLRVPSQFIGTVPQFSLRRSAFVPPTGAFFKCVTRPTNIIVTQETRLPNGEGRSVHYQNVEFPYVEC
jgi:hypothetical protein